MFGLLLIVGTHQRLVYDHLDFRFRFSTLFGRALNLLLFHEKAKSLFDYLVFFRFFFLDQNQPLTKKLRINDTKMNGSYQVFILRGTIVNRTKYC